MPRDHDNHNRPPRGPRSRPPAKGGARGGGKDGGRGGARSDDRKPAWKRDDAGRAERGGGRSGVKRSFPKRREGEEASGFEAKRSFGAKGKFGDKPRGKFSDKPRDERRPRSRDDTPSGERKRYESKGRSETRGEFSDRPRFSRSERPAPRRDERGEETRERPRSRFSGERSAQGSTYAKREGRDERPQRFNKDRSGADSKPREFRGRRDESRGEARTKRFDRPRDAEPRGDRPRTSWKRDDNRNEARSRDDRPRSDFKRDTRERDDGPRRRPDGDRPARGAGARFGGDKRAPRKFGEDTFGDKKFSPRQDYKPRRDDERRDFKPRDARPREEAGTKTGDRIAKVLARVGLCSRRDAEEWIEQGRVSVNGRIINSPALNVTPRDKIAIDGEPIPERERTRLFLYHKPRGLVTTHSDPEGRKTVFDALPAELPRLISVGRLDYNTEGLLLLTNDGGLARVLELPATGWLRRYRVRAFGEIDQATLDGLRKGIEVEGVRYGEIEASLDRKQGDNTWLTFAIREGKNREVRNVLRALGLDVNRLIRLSYGPFQLEDLAEGEVREIRPSVLREQLGERLVAKSGADLTSPLASEKPAGKRGAGEERATRAGLIADRKGRRILVERTISADDDNRSKGRAGPKRGHVNRSYHGKPPQRSGRPERGSSDKPPTSHGPGKRGR